MINLEIYNAVMSSTLSLNHTQRVYSPLVLATGSYTVKSLDFIVSKCLGSLQRALKISLKSRRLRRPGKNDTVFPDYKKH